MQVRFVFGWWIHYKLGALAVDAATFFVMCLGHDTPFHEGSIQKYSFNFILLLDLLPKKDFVFNLDYLETFSEDGNLENYRKLDENAPQLHFYVTYSLYLRSDVLPIALLFKFRDISLPHGLHSLVEEFIYPTTNKGFQTWVEAFDGCGG